jgi:H+/gluconate symporter-like permease
VWRVRHAAEGSADFQWSLCLVLATTLLVIPMFAPYNQVLLLPVAMAIVRASGRLWRASRLSRFLLGIAAVSVLWPWLGAMGLVLALWFLPSSTVQRAWVLPLVTNFAIPVMLWALVMAGKSDLRSKTSDA